MAKQPRATNLPEATSADSLAALRERLVAIVRSALGDIAVSHAPPQDSPANAPRSAVLYCFEIAPAVAPARQRLALQFNARFLVTTACADAAAAADDLAALAFAALDETGLEVGLEPLPTAVWAALGTAPRPSFTVTVPVRQVRPSQPVSPVREAVLRLGVAVAPLRGLLLAHDDTPLAGGRIELSALGLSTRSAADGSFAFASVPAGRTLRLLASARGCSADFQVQAGGAEAVRLNIDLSHPQL
jgi:hypothetical protein